MDATNTKHNHRPLLVTMICSFYIIFWALQILSILAASIMRMTTAAPAWGDFLAQLSMVFVGQQTYSFMTWVIMVGLIAGVAGYWLFQKWSVFVYGATSIALFIYLFPSFVILSNAPTKLLYAMSILYVLVAAFVPNIILIVLGAVYYKKMK